MRDIGNKHLFHSKLNFVSIAGTYIEYMLDCSADAMVTSDVNYEYITLEMTLIWLVVRLGFITVRVSAPPRILDQNKTIDSFVGETVMLRCQVTGIPPPQVKWYKEIMDSGETIREGRHAIIYHYYCKY